MATKTAARSKESVTQNRLSDLCLLCVTMDVLESVLLGTDSTNAEKANRLIASAAKLAPTFAPDLENALPLYIEPFVTRFPAFRDEFTRMAQGTTPLGRLAKFGKFFRTTMALGGSTVPMDSVFTEPRAKASARKIRAAAQQEGKDAIRLLDAVPVLSGATTITRWVDLVAKGMGAEASETEQEVRTVEQVTMAVVDAVQEQQTSAVTTPDTEIATEQAQRQFDAQETTAAVVAASPHPEVARIAAVAAQVATRFSSAETLISNAHLSEEQEAVVRTRGRLRVRAGAGSGKTHTLAAKIAAMVAQGVPPDRILAVSFTKKAAGEIGDRLTKKYRIDGVRTQTTDSFTFQLVVKNPESAAAVADADRKGIPIKRGLQNLANSDKLLKIAYEQIWMKPNPNQATYREVNYSYEPANQWFNIGEELKEYQGYFSFKELSTEIGRLRAAGVSSAEMKRVAQEEDIFYDRVLAAFYAAFIFLKKNHPVFGPCLDHQDNLELSALLLEKDQRIRNMVQGSLDGVFVDEAQDLNPQQKRLFLAVGAKAKDFAFIGDKNQSIYAFRGSDPTLFDDLEAEGFKDMTLSDNYRSGNAIVEAANQLISNNEGQNLSCKAVPSSGEGIIQALQFLNHKAASEYLVQQVKSGIGSGKKAADFGVLTRTIAEQDEIVTKLMAEGIPFISRVKYFNRRSVRALLSWLVLLKPQGLSIELINDSVIDASMFPDFGLGSGIRKVFDQVARGNFLQYLLQGGVPYPDATNQRKDYGKRLRNDAVRDMVKKIKDLRTESMGLSTSQIILTLLNLSYKGESFKSKLIKELGDSTDDDGKVVDTSKLSPEELEEHQKEIEGEAMAPLQPLLDLAKNVQDVGNFLANVQKLKQAEDTFGNKDDKADAVPVLTVHQWKGLEAPHVFVFATAGVFPSPRGNEEEERRLFYVAITRGKEQVDILTEATNSYGKLAKPSKFIEEACVKIQYLAPTQIFENEDGEDEGEDPDVAPVVRMASEDEDEFLMEYEAATEMEEFTVE